MKKNIAGVSAVLVLMATALLFSQTTAQYQISLYVGDVKVSHNGKNWGKAEAEMELKEADTIRTGNDSYCDIMMRGRGSFRVLDNTMVVVKTLRRQVEEIRVKKGRALFNITKKLERNEQFRVETDVGVAAVRGTEFVITADSEKLNVQVAKGAVAIRRNVKVPQAYKNDPEVERLLTVEAKANQSLEITMDENRQLEQQLARVKRNRDEVMRLLGDSQASTAKRVQIMRENINRVFDELNSYDEDGTAPEEGVEAPSGDQMDNPPEAEEDDASSAVDRARRRSR